VLNTYANDRFNNLLTTDNGELFTQYSYLYNTNLPISKRVTDKKSIYVRTFYHYDHNKALIEEICDNGTGADKDDLTGVTQRIIKKITPRMEGTGIGLPIIEEIYGYDTESGSEKLISKVVNTYNRHYKISKQDIYDSHDKWSHSLEWIYDTQGNLVKEIDALGNHSIYRYDDNYNRIYHLSSSGQKEFFYTYDLMNRLIKKELKDPQGRSYTTSYRYDVMGNLTSEIDHYGNETQFIYDHYNRCVQTIRPQLVTLHKEYDESDNVICEIDAEGGITRRQFNSFNKPVAMTYPDGSQEFIRYNINGTIAEKREKNGTKRVYQYDALERVLEERILDAGGVELSVKTNSYDAFHLISSTDAMGLTTTYSYDYAGRLIQEQTEEKKASKTYDALGRMETETLHNGEESKVSRFFYDLKNQLLETVIEDLSGNQLNRSSVEYDQEGRKHLIKQYDAQGCHSTLIDHDALDRPISVTLPNGTYFYAIYDDQIARKRLINPEGQETLTLFDSLGRIAVIEKRNLQGALIHRKEHHYNLNGKLLTECTTVYTPNRPERPVINAYQYDTIGNLTEQIEGLGDPMQRITSYSYNLCGQKSCLTKADGIQIYYEYDVLGRLSHEFSSDKSIDTYWEYNLKNQPTRITDKQSTTLRSYDLYGRLVQEKLGNDLAMHYSYDLADRLTSLQYPDGTTSHYNYNATSLKQVSYKDQTVSYDYDSFGQLSSMHLSNGDTTHYRYDEMQRIASVESSLWSQNHLTYNSIGHLTSYTINGEQSRFHYDDYNQIAKEEGSFNHLYTHDSMNNRNHKVAHE